ncbi:MAG: hypothetical protein R3C11_16000 [Planctomycetaceae bacterium]
MKPAALETDLNYLDEISGWLREYDHSLTRLTTRLIEIRRHLHSHPEPSGEEVETTNYIAELFRELGLKPVIKQDKIGLTVDFDLGVPTSNTPLVAIRADIDALRIPDEKKVSYSSQNPGVMHACGHDAHTTIVSRHRVGCIGDSRLCGRIQRSSSSNSAPLSTR